jgi:hypothetical protein
MLAAALLVAGCGTPKSAPAPAVEVSFARDLQPTFAQNCMPCHSGTADAKSSYDLSGYPGALGTGKDAVANVLPAQPDASLLYTMLREGKMPPTGPLEARTVELVRRWIEAGAKDN